MALPTSALLLATLTSAALPPRAAQASSLQATIAGGREHSCAIKAGVLYCWGLNDFGQLGTGNNANSNTPVPVIGTDSGVTAVAAGRNHTCAIWGGALYCWGRNNFGQLGTGNNANSNTPVPVIGTDSGVTAVAAGAFHT